MSKQNGFTLDENTRRYYLDVMGIQCWQLLVNESTQPETQQINKASVVDQQNDSVPDSEKNRDVQHQENVTSGEFNLNDAIKHCDQCMLHRTRQQAISGRGNLSAELMIILLSPSAGDDASGIICDGEEQELLSKMLSAINISIEDVYITSLLKCSVPENHTISPREIQSCDLFLQQQIQLIKPKQLVILGETAIRCLLQNTLTLDDYRSMNNTEDFRLELLPLFVSYSPGELLQRPENKRKAWTDLQQLQSIIASY